MITNWTTNAILKNHNVSAQVKHSYSPLPRTEQEALEGKGLDLFWLSFFSIIGWSLIPTSAIVFIVKERETLVKQQQYVSGVGIVSYWLSNLVWDMIKFALSVSIVFVIFLLWDFKDLFYTEHGQLQSLLLGFFLFGCGSFSLTYMFSFAFNSMLKALVNTMTYFLGTGVVGYMANSVLAILARIDPDDFYFWDKLVDVSMSLLNPVYAFIRLFTQISLVHNSNSYEFSHDAWDYDLVAKYHYYMSYTIYLCVGVLIAIEFSTVNFNLEADTNEVAPEQYGNHPNQIYIQNQNQNQISSIEASAVTVQNVNKVYSGLLLEPKEAVKSITFEGKYNSCFVILGTEGVGKSSLFKCMTGEVSPTKGDIYIDGKSITKNQNEVRKLIGYCPQDNSIIDLLTASEHLYFYGRLKYLEPVCLHNSVEQLLDMMNLRMNGEILAGRFSEGNKRKLMVACALIGKPKAILLDEPSTGMDPEAKRFMWNSIQKFKRDSGVVMTTHSMDEAEALADHLAIMKQGEFKFVGTLSQLRSQYSLGLYVDLMFKVSSQDITQLKQDIGFHFERVNMTQVQRYLKHFTNSQLSWDQVKTFGNGKIIDEQLATSSVKEYTIETETREVDSVLLLEFLLVIRQISRVIHLLKSKYLECKIDMENIGQLLRFNIQSDSITCGSLFNLLDSKDEKQKEYLMINYYSIANSKMETILRSFIEDDTYNSTNSCNIITEYNEKNVINIRGEDKVEVEIVEGGNKLENNKNVTEI
eukprot:Mrub_01109.p1 GENE.Mrub_01109~~Mrub_01109.p1  ORF type:complete len:782 (-),score=153.79 Mrub_01109:67-2325(-)